MTPETLALINQINKKLGEGTLVTGSEMAVTGRITSGSLGLDVILGGGWPVNQWHEIIGKESHGKTAIALKTVAANQAKNPDFVTLWVAAEKYDVGQAEAIGVDNSRVVVLPTQDMELAYETMLQFAERRACDLIVLDSYPALIPAEEAEKSMDESVMAIGARLTGKFFRKAGKATKRSLTGDDRPVTGLIINQWRDAIGVFSPQGTAQTTPGGNAKNYFFYTRVEVKRDEYIDETRPGHGKARVGQVIKFRTIKNKSAPPQQVATVDFYFRDAPFLGFLRGEFDIAKEIFVYAVLYGIIQRRGAYYILGDNKWQGKEAVLDHIRANTELQEKLLCDVIEQSRRPDRELCSQEEQ